MSRRMIGDQCLLCLLRWSIYVFSLTNTHEWWAVSRKKKKQTGKMSFLPRKDGGARPWRYTCGGLWVEMLQLCIKKQPWGGRGICLRCLLGRCSPRITPEHTGEIRNVSTVSTSPLWSSTWEQASLDCKRWRTSLHLCFSTQSSVTCSFHTQQLTCRVYFH